jgi:uncharacterized protein
VADISETPWQVTGQTLTLRVRLTPNAPRDEITGVDQFDGSAVLKARVRALPEDGEANRAVETLVAKWLGLPKSSVAVSSGHKSRVKILSIDGDHVALAKQLTEKCAAFTN